MINTTDAHIKELKRRLSGIMDEMTANQIEAGLHVPNDSRQARPWYELTGQAKEINIDFIIEITQEDDLLPADRKHILEDWKKTRYEFKQPFETYVPKEEEFKELDHLLREYERTFYVDHFVATAQLKKALDTLDANMLIILETISNHVWRMSYLFKNIRYNEMLKMQGLEPEKDNATIDTLDAQDLKDIQATFDYILEKTIKLLAMQELVKLFKDAFNVDSLEKIVDRYEPDYKAFKRLAHEGEEIYSIACKYASEAQIKPYSVFKQFDRLTDLYSFKSFSVDEYATLLNEEEIKVIKDNLVGIHAGIADRIADAFKGGA